MSRKDLEELIKDVSDLQANVETIKKSIASHTKITARYRNRLDLIEAKQKELEERFTDQDEGQPVEELEGIIHRGKCEELCIHLDLLARCRGCGPPDWINMEIFKEPLDNSLPPCSDCVREESACGNERNTCTDQVPL